eukprot:13660794-Alexandrium_andersonii.AAC.1
MPASAFSWSSATLTLGNWDGEAASAATRASSAVLASTCTFNASISDGWPSMRATMVSGAGLGAGLRAGV